MAAAAHTANVTCEGGDILIRITKPIRLGPGLVSVREIEECREIVLSPLMNTNEPNDTWAAFLNDMSQRPQDPEFMKERPMNRLPACSNQC